MKSPDFHDTQCIFCKSKDLILNQAFDESHIHPDAVQCGGCGKTFPSVFGLPYLGSFGESDIVSLIEISSFSDRFTTTDEKGNLKLTNYKGLDYPLWIRAIEEYATADRPDGILKKYFNLDQEPSWFPNRLREHLSFNTVLSDLDLRGRTVLDIGAGSGFDSLKYAHRGAQVTAMEFNPVLAAVGKANFPQIRWIGGSSYTLPFADCSFDFVTANAALHHLLNIPRTMEEMLRVLKPGGKIITISDSFTPSGTSDLDEAKIFNNHPDVLLGLNEQAPSFDKFVKVLIENRKHLDVTFFTHIVYDLAQYSRSWKFDEALELLSHRGGYFAAILIHKLQNFSVPSHIPEKEIISPFDYTHSLADQPTAMNLLSDRIPVQFTNLPVLSEMLPKFRLMNGWKLPENDRNHRRFYKRGRLFMESSKISAKTLNATVNCAYFPENDIPVFSVYLNNREIHSMALARGVETPISIQIPVIDIKKKVSVLEFRLKTRLESHDGNLVSVSEIGWSEESVRKDLALAESFGIETLLEFDFKDKVELSLLLSTDLKHSLNIINRIRKESKKLSGWIPAGQERFYSWIPHFEIQGTFPDYNLASDAFRNFEFPQGAKIDLIIATDDSHAELLSRKSVKALQKPAYRILENGFGKKLI